MLNELLSRTDSPPKVWLTPEEAASYLGVARSTIYKWINGRTIPFCKIPGSSLVRFRVETLDKWIQDGGEHIEVSIDSILQKLRA